MHPTTNVIGLNMWKMILWKGIQLESELGSADKDFIDTKNLVTTQQEHLISVKL